VLACVFYVQLQFHKHIWLNTSHKTKKQNDTYQLILLFLFPRVDCMYDDIYVYWYGIGIRSVDYCWVYTKLIVRIMNNNVHTSTTANRIFSKKCYVQTVWNIWSVRIVCYEVCWKWFCFASKFNKYNDDRNEKNIIFLLYFCRSIVSDETVGSST